MAAQTDWALPTTYSDSPATKYGLWIFVGPFGKQYIYIDVVCIQQDNNTNLVNPILYTYKTYGCAKLTVVGRVVSNAWAGLPRIGSTPEPSLTEQMRSSIH